MTVGRTTIERQQSVAQRARSGASVILDRLRVYRALIRPRTLAMPMIAVAASAVVAVGVRRGEGSGAGVTGQVVLAALAMAAMNAASNVLNQYFDVEADRINKPWRPLPAGQGTPSEALGLSGGLYAAALALAWFVGPTPGSGLREVFGLAMLVAIATFVYSAPPLRTKRRAWAAQATIALPRGVLLPVCG
jgi:4-hydroxybenzoate polyprenyltransferase